MSEASPRRSRSAGQLGTVWFGLLSHEPVLASLRRSGPPPRPTLRGFVLTEYIVIAFVAVGLVAIAVRFLPRDEHGARRLPRVIDESIGTAAIRSVLRRRPRRSTAGTAGAAATGGPEAFVEPSADEIAYRIGAAGAPVPTIPTRLVVAKAALQAHPPAIPVLPPAPTAPVHGPLLERQLQAHPASSLGLQRRIAAAVAAIAVAIAVLGFVFVPRGARAESCRPRAAVDPAPTLERAHRTRRSSYPISSASPVLAHRPALSAPSSLPTPKPAAANPTPPPTRRPTPTPARTTKPTPKPPTPVAHPHTHTPANSDISARSHHAAPAPTPTPVSRRPRTLAPTPVPTTYPHGRLPERLLAGPGHGDRGGAAAILPAVR